jgi:hypothetical protein
LKEEPNTDSISALSTVVTSSRHRLVMAARGGQVGRAVGGGARLRGHQRVE